MHSHAIRNEFGPGFDVRDLWALMGGRAAAAVEAVAAAARATATAEAHGGRRSVGRRGGPRPFPRPRPPRRRPRRAARAPRRGAAQRLRADAGDRAAQRGRLAPEPRLDLPGAPAARGRGAGPGRRVEGRRLFELTDEGREHVEEHREELKEPWEAIADSVGEGMLELR